MKQKLTSFLSSHSYLTNSLLIGGVVSVIIGVILEFVGFLIGGILMLALGFSLIIYVYIIYKPPKADFIREQFPPFAQLTELTEDAKTVLDITKTSIESFMREYGELNRQKNLWLIQLITIAGTIVGGFILTQQSMSLTTKMGLALLFIIISFGLTWIYKENKNQLELTQRGLSKQIDYSVCLMLYFNLIKLEQKQALSQIDQNLKGQSWVYMIKTLQEIGLAGEDGNIKIGGVSEKLEKRLKKFDVSYILIVLFLISILIIIFPNTLERILETIKN